MLPWHTQNIQPPDGGEDAEEDGGAGRDEGDPGARELGFTVRKLEQSEREWGVGVGSGSGEE